jgi:hypothetical protein
MNPIVHGSSYSSPTLKLAPTAACNGFILASACVIYTGFESLNKIFKQETEEKFLRWTIQIYSHFVHFLFPCVYHSIL